MTARKSVKPQSSKVLTFQLREATHFQAINQALELTSEELASLEQNGFVVSDRLAFEQFKRAYAYIYWSDLPVLVTTDSILHAIHQTYDRLLMQLEATTLTPQLIEVLSATRDTLRAAASSMPDARLKALYD